MNIKELVLYNKKQKEKAILKYLLDKEIMDIQSVYVPKELRGKGLAEKIVLRAFDLAKRKEYKVIPTCPYVRDTFLKKHEEFNDLIVE